MKEIPAEKLNMVLALHYLHGLSRKQINRISGLHYTQVDSHIAKQDKQIASGELSRDDIMASAESANKRLGLEELVAKDGEKDMKVAAKASKDTAKKLVEEINADKKIHPIIIDEDSRKKLDELGVRTIPEIINDICKEEENPGADCGGILRESIGKNMYPFNDPKELQIPLPENFATKHVSDTRCVVPYAVAVLDDVIDRIKNGSIIITCLSISEEDFSTLSINWRSQNEAK